MIKKLSIQITDLICTEDYNNPKDRAKIQYGLNIVLSEGFKAIFLFIFFNLFHVANYFYLSLLILISIRIFSGGIHLKTNLNCLLLTTFIFIFTSIIAPFIPLLPKESYFSITILSVIILILKAPKCSVIRPIKNKQKRFQFKIVSIFLTLLWSILLFTAKSTSYLNCGFATILIQNAQLAFAKNKQ